MNLSKLIELYKGKRKKALLQNLCIDFKKKYACVGVGLHSLSTIYPILSYLNVPIKYILTEKSKFGGQLALKFPNAKATNNYEQILLDPEIQGVFISAKPSAHFALTLKALQHDKHVFVEKPVCYSLNELEQLIFVCKTSCIVGLQKRYSVSNNIIKKRYPSTIYYHYRYAVGNYPEGNPIYELFIHPIDNIVSLFGHGHISAGKRMQNKSGIFFIIQIEHESGVYGTVEISTDHNWSDPVDSLRLETANEQVLVKYPNYIETVTKEQAIFGIPLNKAFQRPLVKKIIYNNTGSINTIEKNILFEAGYFSELSDFLSLVENENRVDIPPSGIQNLLNTYKILDSLQNF